MTDKVARCAEGAAYALGVEVEIDKRKLYSAKKVNIPLIKILWNNYKELGAPVDDWEESISRMPLASTDFGDVSQVVPAAGSYIGIAPDGTPGHSIQLADATMTEDGLDAMIVGTKALGMTLVELLFNQNLIHDAREYFNNN
jgi:metal-dependent amidase/aminoacylase/carboxypeptidase family protein